MFLSNIFPHIKDLVVILSTVVLSIIITICSTNYEIIKCVYND